ncbi:MAG: hypothetical protein IPG44_15245 [Anaerolineales bacterium]|jgi:uncharacterized membrane protein YhiD involved in acid resistance|nr:hypothetical protein [Chloroflexota bacterium]MBK6647073.1 hypothetical protein [Anaerolineales bacterium]MCC6987220.1 hypothetical protein [Anaerolineales bacterium]
MRKDSPLPPGLRTWFVVHFAADMLFGIPLLFFPEWTMGLLGWSPIDPIASRVVGAALMGIGIESWLGRDSSAEVYRAMLNLKVIWSSSAIIGIGLGLWNGGAAAGWLFLVVFMVFWAVWVYYRRKF